MVHGCNSSTSETGGRGLLGVQDQPELHSDCQASEGYIGRLYLKKKKWREERMTGRKEGTHGEKAGRKRRRSLMFRQCLKFFPYEDEYVDTSQINSQEKQG